MSDLDLPLLPSAEQIRRRQFATVRRGFDPDQVQEYLNQVAIQVETLETELRDERLGSSARATTEAGAVKQVPQPASGQAAAPPAPMPADAYEQFSKRFATVLQTADAEAQRLVTNAKAEAKKLIDESRAEADRIRLDAQANAEDARAKSAAELERARVEADRVVGGLEQRRETLMTQMHEMQTRLLSVAKDLDVPVTESAAAPTGGVVAKTPPVTPAPPAPTATPVGKHAPPATTPAAPKEATPTPVGRAAEGNEDMVDPRYEDLWASTETRSVDIPDLGSLDIDFDDEEGK
jgi:cell division initiation protein